jgi:hypothetical protein
MRTQKWKRSEVVFLVIPYVMVSQTMGRDLLCSAGEGWRRFKNYLKYTCIHAQFWKNQIVQVYMLSENIVCSRRNNSLFSFTTVQGHFDRDQWNSCEHSNELSGSIKYWAFLSGWATVGFSRRTRLAWVSTEHFIIDYWRCREILELFRFLLSPYGLVETATICRMHFPQTGRDVGSPKFE